MHTLKQLLTSVVVGAAVSSFFLLSDVNAQPCQTKGTSTTDYCQTIPQHGIFLCVSTQVPEAYSCGSSCSSAVCHYIHLRNVTGCANPRINKIEITITKDTGSSQFSICHPFSQWGQTPWTSEWAVTISGASVSTSTCYNWGGDTQRTFTFNPPGGTNPDYTLTDLNHWSVTICGGSGYSIKIFYSDGTDYTFSPTITNTVCPPGC